MLYMIRMKFYYFLGAPSINSLIRGEKEPDRKEKCWIPMDDDYLWNSGLNVTEGSL